MVAALVWGGYSLQSRLQARAEPTLPARTAAEVADWAAGPHPEPRSGLLELHTDLGLGDFGTTTGESGGSLHWTAYPPRNFYATTYMRRRPLFQGDKIVGAVSVIETVHPVSPFTYDDEDAPPPI